MPLAAQFLVAALGKLFLLGSLFCPESWEQSAISPSILMEQVYFLLVFLSLKVFGGTELNFTEVTLDNVFYYTTFQSPVI